MNYQYISKLKPLLQLESIVILNVVKHLTIFKLRNITDPPLCSRTTINGCYKALKFTTIILAVFAAIGLPAQTQTTSNKHNEQVTIVSSYDPSINRAFKLNTAPDALIFNIEKPEFTYQALNIDQPTEITLNPIKPVVINADKRISVTKNSLRAGVGSLFSPYLDFFHSSGQKSSYRFDAHLYHLSTFRNIEHYSPSPETNTSVSLNYKKFFSYHIFDIGFDYSLKTNRYYGFKPDDYPGWSKNEDRLKQMYNLARLNFTLSSNYRNNKKLSNKINVEAYYYSDRFKTSETNAKLSFDIHKNFNVSDVLDYQELGLSGKVSYFQNIDSLLTTNNILASATPYFKGNYGMFNFYIGLNFNVLNTEATKFYFYPIIDINMNLVPDVLTVFGGIDGKVQKNSFLILSKLNPWVGSTIPLKWDRSFTFYGGIRGNIAQKVNFSTQVSLEKFNNMFFFVNVPDDTITGYVPGVPYNKFDTWYDKGSKFTINGELTFAASDKVNILFGAKYNTYSLDSLDKPYQKPTSVVKFGISFIATKKIRIWSDVYYYGIRTALDLSALPSTEVDMDAFIDLNLGVDYRLTDQFSVFLSLTNLLNKQYQRYYNYPVQGIQIMGGLMYKF